MFNNFVTHLQLFAIGFSFGVAGPCLLSCGPVLLVYVAASKRTWRKATADILIFLVGRLSAYAVLGALAGLSGVLLEHFTSPALKPIFKISAGIISIIFGVFIFIYRRSICCPSGSTRGKVYNLTGLYLLGFMVGAAPCAPLIALLFDIALMSKGALAGALFAISFGLGTCLSAAIIMAALAGIFTGLAAKILNTEPANFIFRTICGLLLVLFGFRIIMSALPSF